MTQQYILVPRETLQSVVNAAEKFRAKVHNGKARSVETYDDLTTVSKNLQALLNEPCEPVAWLQVGLAPCHEGDVIARTSHPKEYNKQWWRFDPLFAPKE